jgi:flagellar motor switch protein FliN/FliY
MSELTQKNAAEVVAACRASATEAAGALSKALDGKFSLGEPRDATYAAATPPEGFDGPGLAVLITVGGVGLALLAPESTRLLPPWYGAPDAAGESKLRTLAQELAALLVPDLLTAGKFEARRVPSLSGALTAGGAAADAALVTIEITSPDHTGQLSIVWPLAAPEALFATPTEGASDQSRSTTQTSEPGANGDRPAKPAKPVGIAALPHYSRSLLKIRIPVSVHLASKKESVQDVVELAAGSIIKFDKGCDELLQMVIGGQTIAEGEAVKIGDKFGFRVTGMLLPREHFVPASRPKAG